MTPPLNVGLSTETEMKHCLQARIGITVYTIHQHTRPDRQNVENTYSLIIVMVHCPIGSLLLHRSTRVMSFVSVSGYSGIEVLKYFKIYLESHLYQRIDGIQRIDNKDSSWPSNGDLNYKIVKEQHHVQFQGSTDEQRQLT